MLVRNKALPEEALKYKMEDGKDTVTVAVRGGKEKDDRTRGNLE